MRQILESVVISIIVGLFLATPATALVQKSSKVVLPSPSPSSAPVVNSYELFWPITAGRVMGDQLYSLKLFKESVREWFILNDFKKSEYNIMLSNKRLVEAEYLLRVKKDYDNARKTEQQAREKLGKAITLKKKAESNATDTSKSVLVLSLTKQRTLVSYLLTQLSGEGKTIMQDYFTYLDSVISTQLQ